MPNDRYGLPLSTDSEAAAAAYCDGVDRLLSAWPGAADCFEQAIAADPDFALAHIARARVHFTYAQPVEARAKVATARALAPLASPRERAHVEILALGMEGQPAQSLAAALEHLDTWPRDALVLSLPLGAFGLFAFSGRADHDAARVALCERHARHYGDDWWFLTYLGWSYTEAGSYGAGRQLTERGFERRKENANAAHALAHALFEQGETGAADQFITDWMPCYDRAGLLYGHIYWHQALLALERGDVARALAIYADRVHMTVSTAPPLNVLTDGASLLWRIQAYGHAVPKDLWREAAGYAEASFPKAGVSFADVHCALASAATGDHAALDRRIGELEARVAQGKLPPGSVVPGICKGVRAFAGGDFAGAVATLEPIAGEVVRIGGSHAQRELFEDTLIVACLRIGETAKARRLIDTRLHRRPSPRDTAWRAGA